MVADGRPSVVRKIRRGRGVPQIVLVVLLQLQLAEAVVVQLLVLMVVVVVVVVISERQCRGRGRRRIQTVRRDGHGRVPTEDVVVLVAVVPVRAVVCGDVRQRRLRRRWRRRW